MNRAWCHYPFSHVAMTTQGDFTVCCEGSGNGMNVTSGHTPSDFINSSFLKDVRDAMLSDNPTEDPSVQRACVRCIKREKEFNTSKRLRDQKEGRHLVDIVDSNIQLHREGKDIQKVFDFNFSGFGNHCNLTCVMCSPYASDKWGKFIKSNRNKVWDQYWTPSLADDMYLSSSYEVPVSIGKEFYDSFESLCREGEIIKINISGGEPLLQPSLLEFFEEMQRRNIDLHIAMTTNGTVPAKVLEKSFGNFDRVIVSVSYDAIGKRAEYIRTGTDWERYEENVFDYHILAKKKPNWNITSFSSIQALNVGYIDELVKWKRDKWFFGGDKWFKHHFVLDPNYLAIQVLPLELRIKYYDKLINEDLDHYHLSNVYAALKRPDVENQKELFKRFVLYLHLLDEKEDEDWRDLWPEFLEYI